MTFPQIDPVAIQIGPLSIHWYGLAYVAGILGWWANSAWLRRIVTHLTKKDIDEYLTNYNMDIHDNIVYMGAYKMSCCINWYKLYFQYRDTFSIFTHLEGDESSTMKYSDVEINSTIETK